MALRLGAECSVQSPELSSEIVPCWEVVQHHSINVNWSKHLESKQATPYHYDPDNSHIDLASSCAFPAASALLKHDEALAAAG